MFGETGELRDGREAAGAALSAQLALLAVAPQPLPGNRWLLLKQREHFDWFSHPLRKLLMLVTGNVLYTAPLTVAVACCCACGRVDKT